MLLVTLAWPEVFGGARWQASQAVAVPTAVQLGVVTLPRRVASAAHFPPWQ